MSGRKAVEAAVPAACAAIRNRILGPALDQLSDSAYDDVTPPHSSPSDGSWVGGSMRGSAETSPLKCDGEPRGGARAGGREGAMVAPFWPEDSFARLGQQMACSEEGRSLSRMVMDLGADLAHITLVDLGADLARRPSVQRTIMRELGRMPLPPSLMDSDDEGDDDEEGEEEGEGRGEGEGGRGFGGAEHCESVLLSAGAKPSAAARARLPGVSDEGLKEELLRNVQDRVTKLTESLEAIRRENLHLRSRLTTTEAEKNCHLRPRLTATEAEKAALARQLSAEDGGVAEVKGAVDKVVRDHLRSQQEARELWRAEGARGAATAAADAEARPAKSSRQQPPQSGLPPSSKEARRRRRHIYRLAAAGVASVIVVAAVALYFGVNPFLACAVAPDVTATAATAAAAAAAAAKGARSAWS
ncbi:hypothetical protein JKP88DRAFT_348733 [Tribonema minus]|uniref:Uncharacterized protein n=1 Tax=Tribonema minus TaxID=303371 RepID=A0A835Z441_9STRA|nr:hypothetical protein JKP88DRAFT_348733 [Tribonema minus]